MIHVLLGLRKQEYLRGQIEDEERTKQRQSEVRDSAILCRTKQDIGKLGQERIVFNGSFKDKVETTLVFGIEKTERDYNRTNRRRIEDKVKTTQRSLSSKQNKNLLNNKKASHIQLFVFIIGKRKTREGNLLYGTNCMVGCQGAKAL